jgi:hypothetical protein
MALFFYLDLTSFIVPHLEQRNVSPSIWLSLFRPTRGSFSPQVAHCNRFTAEASVGTISSIFFALPIHYSTFFSAFVPQ